MGRLSRLFDARAPADRDTTALGPEEQRRVDGLLAEHPEAVGDPRDLRGLGEFLRAQATWEPGPPDAVLLADRDVANAVADAQQRLRSD